MQMEDRFKFRLIIEQNYKTINGTFKGIQVYYCNGFIQGKTKTSFFGNGKKYSFLNSQIKHINQCTGLKNKNGKLIYEGDRVYIASEEEYATIEWSDDLARFNIHFEDEAVCADFDNYYSKELAVIDNIYENPELLSEVE